MNIQNSLLSLKEQLEKALKTDFNGYSLKIQNKQIIVAHEPLSAHCLSYKLGYAQVIIQVNKIDKIINVVDIFEANESLDDIKNANGYVEDCTDEPGYGEEAREAKQIVDNRSIQLW